MSWILGNGEKIAIWDYKWITFKEDLRKPISPISSPNTCTKELWDLNKRWDENKLEMWRKFSKPISPKLTGRTRKFALIRKMVVYQQIGLQSFEKCGEPIKYWKCLLKLKRNIEKVNLPPKLLMFGWKCINNGIAINVLRNSKMSYVIKICPNCETYEESIKYALISLLSC